VRDSVSRRKARSIPWTDKAEPVRKGAPDHRRTQGQSHGNNRNVNGGGVFMWVSPSSGTEGHHRGSGVNQTTPSPGGVPPLASRRPGEKKGPARGTPERRPPVRRI